MICNTISYKCLKKFLKKDLGIAFTGNEDIPLSIIIIKGFSNEAVYTDNEILINNLGEYVLLRPFTQIRAGATRPSVFIMDKI